MGEFRVYAKLSGLIEGDTPDDAKRHAQRILTTLLEPRGFEVVGVAAVVGDHIPGKLATVESVETEPDADSVDLLKWLQHEVFSEDVRLSAPRVRKIQGINAHEYPLTISLAGMDAVGRLVEVPPEIRKLPYNPSKPEKERGVPYGQATWMKIPPGEYGYGWQASLTLDPSDIGKASRIAERFNSEMVRAVEHNLKGVIKLSDKRSDGTDQETGAPIVTTSGLFTSPISPDEMATALSEKIGIRSILPKEVAETDPDEVPVTAPKPVAERHDIASLLGALLK